MRPVKPWIKHLFTVVFAAMLMIVAGATLVGWLSRRWLWADLACHFRLQYLWIALILGLLLVGIGQYRWAAAAAVVALLNLATIAPFYWPRPPVASLTATRLRVVSLNIYSANRRHDLVVEFLRGCNADVVLLLEVTDGWHDVLDALRQEYPWQRVEARYDNFGLALLSRLPPDDSQVVYAGGADVPSIVARYASPAGPLTVVGTHPLPPGSTELWRLRNDQLTAIARLAHNQTGPLVVMGDLNVTSWSSGFDLLLAGTRLRDSRRGFGVQPSWPQWLAIGRIPIDHCLVSPEIDVVRRFVGPDVGSDHYPIVVDLALENGE